MENSSKAADFISQLRFTRCQEPVIPQDCRPDDSNAGYLVQREVVQRLLHRYGGHTVGYKVACTNILAQRLLNLNEPFFGRLLSSSVYTSPARLNPADFSMRLIEAEFAFEMAKDLPIEGAPYRVEAVSAGVAAVLPAIEIVDTRFTDWTAVGAPSLIADNACNAAWVQGKSYDSLQAFDLKTHEVALMVNGETKRRGRGFEVLGHPLNSLTWLANALSKQGKTLKAGDLISTGVCTDVYFAEPGDEIVADFGELGTVELSFNNTSFK